MNWTLLYKSWCFLETVTFWYPQELLLAWTTVWRKPTPTGHLAPLLANLSPAWCCRSLHSPVLQASMSDALQLASHNRLSSTTWQKQRWAGTHKSDLYIFQTRPTCVQLTKHMTGASCYWYNNGCAIWYTLYFTLMRDKSDGCYILWDVSWIINKVVNVTCNTYWKHQNANSKSA